MPTPCVLFVPTDQAVRILRRYTLDSTCTTGSIHDAWVPIGTAPLVQTLDGMIATVHTPDSDPRWPTTCACGYRFRPSDPWQTIQEPLLVDRYGRTTTTHQGSPPPGAMWQTDYLADLWPGPDGLCLTVILPSGEPWVIDGPSSHGDGWTRVGVPPLITVQPSILTPRYHGWLTDGVLSDDLEGRTYA